MQYKRGMHTVQDNIPSVNAKLCAFNYLMNSPYITNQHGVAEPFWDLQFHGWHKKLNDESTGVFTFLWQCDKEIIHINANDLASVKMTFNEDEMENILRQNKTSDAGCGC